MFNPKPVADPEILMMEKGGTDCPRGVLLQSSFSGSLNNQPNFTHKKKGGVSPINPLKFKCELINKFNLPYIIGKGDR